MNDTPATKQYETLLCVGGPCDGQRARVDSNLVNFAIQGNSGKAITALEAVGLPTTAGYCYYTRGTWRTPNGDFHVLHPYEQTPETTFALLLKNYKGANSNG